MILSPPHYGRLKNSFRKTTSISLKRRLPYSHHLILKSGAFWLTGGQKLGILAHSSLQERRFVMKARLRRIWNAKACHHFQLRMSLSSCMLTCAIVFLGTWAWISTLITLALIWVCASKHQCCECKPEEDLEYDEVFPHARLVCDSSKQSAIAARKL